MQADVFLEKPRVLVIDMQATGSKLRHWLQSEHRRLQSPPPLSHFLLQGHTYSKKKKIPPPNSATAYEFTGAIYIKTTFRLVGP